jgi:hypothetical protein
MGCAMASSAFLVPISTMAPGRSPDQWYEQGIDQEALDPSRARTRQDLPSRRPAVATRRRKGLRFRQPVEEIAALHPTACTYRVLGVPAGRRPAVRQARLESGIHRLPWRSEHRVGSSKTVVSVIGHDRLPIPLGLRAER